MSEFLSRLSCESGFFSRVTILLTVALIVAVGPASAAKQADAAEGIEPEVIDELRALVAEARCAELLERLNALRDRAPNDPDLLAFEANCRFSAGREVSRAFDAEAYERLQIALGGTSVPGELRSSLSRTTAERPIESIERGLSLFRRAAQAAPARADLTVGLVAALSESDRLDEVGGALTAFRGSLDEPAKADLLAIVEDMLRAGRHDDAAALAQALDARWPSEPLGPLAKASCAAARYRSAAALEAFTAARERRPDHRVARREEIRLMLFARRFDEALSLLLPLASESLDMKVWVALVLGRQNVRSAASAWSEVRSQLAHSQREDRAMVERIAEHYQKVLRASQQPTPIMRLRAAHQFARHGFVLPAVVEADAALLGDPSLIEAWVFLAELYRDQFMFDLGAAAYERALALATELPPGDVAYSRGKLLLGRARLLVGLRRDDEASEAYAAAAEAGRPAPYEHGFAALKAGKRSQAEALFREEIERGGPRASAAEIKLRGLGED